MRRMDTQLPLHITSSPSNANGDRESTGTHTVSATVTVNATVTIVTSVDVTIRKVPLSCSMLRTLGECHQRLACLEDCDTQTTQP
jgi:hypothetical protein